MNEEVETPQVIMVDEQGNEQAFDVMDVVEVHDRQYALLMMADNEELSEVLIMRLENDTLVNIEDEEEFNHVVGHLEGHAHT